MWGKWEKLSSTAGRAILPRSAESAEIATAIDLVRRGLALLPRHVLERLLDASSPASEKSLHEAGGEPDFAHAARARGARCHGRCRLQ
jgi:hypothetical protein